jgi:hypothetical protein
MNNNIKQILMDFAIEIKELQRDFDKFTTSDFQGIEEATTNRYYLLLKPYLNEKGIKIEEKKICCICKKKYIGWGNNAQPVKKGLCCDECNFKVIVPARIKEITK